MTERPPPATPADSVTAGTPPTAAIQSAAKPPSATEQALARLAHSRAALRQHMLPPEPSSEDGAARGAAPAARWVRRAQRWLGRHPAGVVLLGLAGRWWRRQAWSPVVAPLLPMAEDLAREANRAWRPWARRHPLALAGGAAALGAAVVALRPWRWLQGPPPRAGTRSGSEGPGWLGTLLRDPVLQATLLTSLGTWLAQARPAPTPGGSPGRPAGPPGAATAAEPAERPQQAHPAAAPSPEMPAQMRH